MAEKDKEVFLTAEGLKKAMEELERLKGSKRQEVAERLRVALGYGDISENSEYDNAKNEQAFLEGRIADLEKMIRHARIIEQKEIATDVVTLGSTVVLKDLEDGAILEYSIVGSPEADPSVRRISNESPVGEAILGRPVGSVVEVKVPAGVLKYEILQIKRDV